MDVDESRLATLLHELVPEPPETITGADVLLAAGRPQARRLRPALAAAGAAATVIAAVGITTLVRPPHVRTGPAAATDPATAATSATTTAAGPCTAATLTARQVAVPKRAQSSAQGLVVAVTNTGTIDCTLHGYPALPPTPAKAGSPPSGDFTHGVRGYAETTPRLLTLAPGRSASFALGEPTGATSAGDTATRLIITDLSFLVPGDTRPVHLTLPDGARVVIELVGTGNAAVTAFVAGTAGPPTTGR